MDYILATFNSRNETLAFVRLLRNGGISCDVINTPSALGGGCAVSARFSRQGLTHAQRTISGARFVTFRGFFYVRTQNGRQIVDAI